MSSIQLKYIKGDLRGRFLLFPLSGAVREAVVGTGFVQDDWDLHHAVIRRATEDALDVEFVLDAYERSQQTPRVVLKKVFVMRLPRDPELWIDTTNDDDPDFGLDPIAPTDKVLALIERVESVVAYIDGTLGAGNRFPSEARPDWVEVHGGRVGSSINQLRVLLQDARDLKKLLEK